MAEKINRIEILKPLKRSNCDEIGAYVFWCLGCKCHHSFEVPRWTFNGDLENPTFSPSLLVDQHNPQYRCHLFVKDGHIEYLSDCHHGLANQTVKMVEHQW